MHLVITTSLRARLFIGEPDYAILYTNICVYICKWHTLRKRRCGPTVCHTSVVLAGLFERSILLLRVDITFVGV